MALCYAISIIFNYYLIELKTFLPGGSGTTIRHNTQNIVSHYAQTKHGTQSCTNKRGHIAHNAKEEEEEEETLSSSSSDLCGHP
jgi:hypothetical protein